MVCSSGWLSIVKHDRMLGAVWIVFIYPHVSLLAVLDLGFVNAHAFYGRLISMDNTAVIDELVNAVVYKRKVSFGTFYDPVGHGIGCKVDSVILVSSCLSFKRNCIYIFTIED